MPRLKPARPARPIDSRLARLLWQWLILGLLLCALLPSARAYNPWIGWLWYWLVAAPAMALAVLHRRRWPDIWQRWTRRLRQPSRRRTGAGRTQARRESSKGRMPRLAQAG